MHKQTAMGLYDADLQMFVEAPREVDQAHLESLRWAYQVGFLSEWVDTAPAGEEQSAC